jgi:hypothetical protein
VTVSPKGWDGFLRLETSPRLARGSSVMATKRLNYPIEPMDLANMRENGVRSPSSIQPVVASRLMLLPLTVRVRR